MTTTIDQQPTADAGVGDVAGAFAERVFGATLGAIDLLTIYLGVRLGLYRALADGAATIAEVGERTGVHPRYVREWLEQQTVAGIVTCGDRTAEPDERRFALPAGHEIALLGQTHPACVAPMALALAGIAGVLDDLAAAYRSGGGVPYARYGADFRDGQAGFNRPAFTHQLAGDWIANGAPDVHHVLSSGPARLADLACGAGWSSIALATAYPELHVDGFDADDASIADARRNAADAGVSDRVRFEVADVTGLRIERRYDVVTVFEAIHDMSRPVDALATCRALAGDAGAVLVMDERTAPSFVEAAGPIEQFLYGASVLHCLPVGMADAPSAATGAVMRPSTLERYATAAGFTLVSILPIDHDLYRLYRLS